jgi:anti-sigma-K factor RskA
MTEPVDPELLAAYALDALDSEDREDVAARLADDPTARREVDEHRAALAALTPNVPRAGAIPDALWARLRVDEVVPAADVDADVVQFAAPKRAAIDDYRRARPGRVLLAVAAVVALLVGVAVGALLAAARSADPDLVAAADAAFDDPDATVTDLATDDGQPIGRVAVLPDGQAYLDADNLAAPDRGRAYQVWQLGGGDPIALGLLGPDELATFRLGGDASGIAISDEPATGSVQPTGPIVASGELN